MTVKSCEKLEKSRVALTIEASAEAVSYTHLTLPTSLSV